MNLHARILLVFTILLGFSASSHADKTNNTVIIKTHQAEVAEAEALLDSWRGDAKVLNAAKMKLDASLRLNPDYAAAHRQYVRYYIMSGYSSGNTSEATAIAAAEASLNEALRLDPESAQNYITAGHLYFLQNRIEDASNALAKARAIGTENPWLALNTASVLLAQGRLDEAAIQYRSVVDSGTKNSKAMSSALDGLITYYRETAEFEKVDALFHQLIAHEPETAWYYGNYAEFLLCTEDNAEAAATQFRIALDRMNYGLAQAGLAAALYRKGVVVKNSQPKLASKLTAEARSLSRGTPTDVVNRFCKGGPAVVAMRTAENR